MSDDPRLRDHRLQQLLRASAPVLLEMITEYVQGGGNPSEVAGCIIESASATAAAPGAEPTRSVEAFLVLRAKALEIAEEAAPEHAHLLATDAPLGRFHVVAVADEMGAVVEFRLPGGAQYGGEA